MRTLRERFESSETKKLTESVARAIDPYYESSKSRKTTAMVSARAAIVAVLKGIRPEQKTTWASQVRHRIDKLLSEIEGQQ